MCVLSFIYSYVQVFDNKTGQATKDERNKGKIQVLIVWPNGAGIRRGKGYKLTLKGLSIFSNYHPDITNEIFQLRSYHPICYQTKANDVRVIRLTVFCQQERQFLESYRWLCKLPEFFQLKEFFSTIKLTTPKKNLQKQLRSFDTENDKIRCTDDSAFQALIVYVKRFLQHSIR